MRLDLALIRAGLIIALTIAIHTARWPAVPFLGPLRFINGISLMFVLILGSRLGSDSVGDVSTGLLGLVRLSGTTAWQWVALRLSQMWIGFVSVWIVRIPALAFVWTLGGARLETILIAEAALGLMFFLISNLALLLSFGAASRRQIGGRIMLLLFVFNTLVVLPASIAGSLNVYWPQLVSTKVVDRLEWVADFGLSGQFSRATSGTSTLADLLPGAALYSGLAVLALLWFWRLVATVGTMTVEDRARPQPGVRRGISRVSRRCWDDALAWQSFVFVGRGGRVVRAKLVAYALLALVAWQAIQMDYKYVAMLTLPVLCGGLLMNAINKPGECLTREFNDKTISTLLLTPHTCSELVAGWRRGAWRLAAPDLVEWSLLTLVSALVHQVAPPIMLCVGLVLVFSQHFFILSPLIPFTFKGVTAGVLLIVLFCVPVSLCIFAGLYAQSAWLVPLLMAPLLLGFTYVLKRSLPYWMEKKLATIL